MIDDRFKMDDSTRYKLYNNDGTSDSETKKIGLAYIFVNQKFYHRRYSHREGAFKDYQNMKKVFKPFGFKLYTFIDKSAKEMMKILSSASKRKDLQNFSCFVCVISSHGEEGPVDKVHGDVRVQQHVIIGSDGMPLKTQDVIDMFNEEKCYALADKPKLFFLQACRENVYEKDRSKRYDHGAEVQIVHQYLQKKKKAFRKSKRDASDARPSNPEDEGLSEKMTEAHLTAEHDSLEEDDEELDPNDDYETDTTDNDSDDEFREKHEKFTQLTEKELTEDSSEQPDSSVTGVVDEADARKKTHRVDTDIRPKKMVDIVGIPCYKDMLVMFASPPGKLAWRSTTEGGWLLVNLHYVVKHYLSYRDISKHDFLSILTEVARQVSFWETDTGEKDSSGKKMIPVIHHQLTKDIVFRIVKTSGLFSRIKNKLGL